MKHLNLLKSTLLLCALIVGSTSLWAADVTIASGSFVKTSVTTGWISTGTGTNVNNCVVYGKDESLTSPTLDLSGYSKVTISISARRYGSLSGSKATIDASIGGVSKGTTNATSTSVAALSDIVFVPTSEMKSVALVFTCTNATSAGSTHGAGIGSITIKGTPSSTDHSVDAEDVVVAYDATGGTIESTISNPVVGGILTAAKKTSADWLTLGSVSGTDVPFTTTTNDTNEDRVATVTLTYTYGSPSSTITKDVTITQGHYVADFATLPFSWPGGGKTALIATVGVTTSSLDSDYADSNAPYLVKFNGNGKFIIVKTDCQPTKVTMGVKMIGGATTSTMSIQESADGETYTKVQDLLISGSTNDIVNLESTEPFKAETRYVKFLYTKGSNVGVGPITISNTVSATISTAEYATFCSPYATDFSTTGVTVYTATAGETSVTLNEVTSGKVPANTPVVLYKAGADGTAINVPVIASADAVGSNNLKVSDGTNPGPNTYVLANKIHGVGFYKWAGGSLTSGKIYLQGASSAREFLGFGDVTGIESLTPALSQGEGAWYDLQGRRVAQPAKGLYIVNGKKVFVP